MIFTSTKKKIEALTRLIDTTEQKREEEEEKLHLKESK